MKLSIVIPAYNEFGTIREILSRVNAVPLEKEIVVVDDCSTDGTGDVLGRKRRPDGAAWSGTIATAARGPPSGPDSPRPPAIS